MLLDRRTWLIQSQWEGFTIELITHQTDQQRFVIELENDEDAVLEYRYIDDDHIDFTRTFVPVSMRGKGIARELVLHGLNWARKHHLDIHASCWYVRRVMSSDQKQV